MSHTQPIGVADGENLYTGEADEQLGNTDQSSDNNNKNENNKGCFGSILGTTFAFIALFSTVIFLENKKRYVRN